MALARPARLPMAVAAGQAVGAAGFAAFGLWLTAALLGIISATTAIGALVMHVTHNHHERKSDGRYRKAPEAHRAGAGRSASNDPGTRARGGAFRAGASMSGPFRLSGRIAPNSQLKLETLVASMSLAGVYASGTNAPSADDAPQPRPAGEFDGKQADFAPGVVTGTRSFDVDKLGRLLGVAYPSVWTPGENVAKCMERADPFGSLYSYERRELREARRPEHSIADCAHGFYGYYEGSNDYYERGRVMGVVEAYGETIIGSRGFRASKARIVALHIPSKVSVGRRRLITRNYPDLPIFESFDAMVADFPPDDAGHGINPTTDPDFWTRKV